MNPKKDQSPAARGMVWIAVVRALILGPAAAAGAGLFAAVCGYFLCLTTGQPWMLVLPWCLRGAFAGLVAGIVMGAVCGIYHVEEDAVETRADTPAGRRSFLPARPAVALYRSEVRRKDQPNFPPATS